MYMCRCHWLSRNKYIMEEGRAGVQRRPGPWPTCWPGRPGDDDDGRCLSQRRRRVRGTTSSGRRRSRRFTCTTPWWMDNVWARWQGADPGGGGRRYVYDGTSTIFDGDETPEVGNGTVLWYASLGPAVTVEDV